jgi:hypothetical protein
MARILDLILIALFLTAFVALVVYKVALMFRYRNDPDKLRALASSGQVLPKRIKRFVYDEDADTAVGPSIPNSGIK